MKLRSKGQPNLQQVDLQTNFMQDLEHSLIKGEHNYYDIDEFQKIYEKKRLLADAIHEYRQKNKYSKENILRAKQRIYQIQQLNDKATKQTVMMRNQMDKINQSHMLARILMMQKMVKIQKENQTMENKRNQYFRIREERDRAMYVSKSIK